jgi:hypothetical protein
MVDRTRCASCGVPLPPAAGRCPSCGHGVGEPVVVAPPRRRPRRPVLLAAAGGAVIAAVVVGMFAGGGGGDAANDRPRGTTTSGTAPTTTTATSIIPTVTLPGALLSEAPLDGTWPDLAGARLLRWAQSGPAELLDPAQALTSQVRLATRGSITRIVPRLDGAVIVAGGRAVYHPQVPGTAGVVDLGPADVALSSDSISAVWLVTGTEGEGARPTVQEVDVLSGPTSVAVSLPTDVQPVAGVDGGLLVRGPDGGYVIGRGGEARRITSGAVVDASITTALVRGCDEALRCGYRLLDVRNGAEREVGIDSTLTWWETHLSPTGTASASIGHDNDHGWRLVIVDFTTGRRHDHVLSTAGSPPPTASVTWSPDGRWLIMGRQDGLSFFRPDADDETVVDRPGSLAAVAVIAPMRTGGG